MKSKLGVAVAVVAVVLGLLIYSAVNQTAKAVVTVEELLGSGNVRNHIRLGARVGQQPIEYITQPERKVSFSVHDISKGGTEIPVVYFGALPDTLKTGMDVIL